MDIWESYERLPPLERIIIIFTITGLLIFAVYWIDRWAKNRKWSSAEGTAAKPFLYRNLQSKADGTLVAYIAYWRYLIFGVLFAAAFYISFQGLIYFYQKLPPGFWKNWDKAATLTFIFLIVLIALPFMVVRFLKSSYKKVQLEIGIDNVRYLTSAARGGTLLSDSYNQVWYKDIISISLRQNHVGGGVIDVEAFTRTYTMLLLLPIAEQAICYRTLDEAIKKWQSKI